MFFVYILCSIGHPQQIYVGFTEDIDARLRKHNEGGNVSTAQHRPWKLIFYCAFENKGRALAFENYLKSHSGKAFSSKHLLNIIPSPEERAKKHDFCGWRRVLRDRRTHV